jgi:L-asparaginase II
MVESRHIGVAIVVAADGRELRAFGDVDALIYPRSTLKLVQAIAVQRAGIELVGEQLVLSTASHSGTSEHVRVVTGILTDAGLDASALQCPADWPTDSSARDAAIRAGRSRERITMNCSGKHAAFLAACVRNDWPTVSYLDPAHPLQVLIHATVEEFTGHAVEHVGIDGCGAPVLAVTLRGLATAVARIAGAAADSGEARLAAAIRAHPWAIDGPGRANTVAIERLGVVAKIGAEGVIVIAAPDGTTVALKMLDGSLRAATLVALGLLVDAGSLDVAAVDEVVATTTERVLGGGYPVGTLRSSLPA